MTHRSVDTSRPPAADPTDPAYRPTHGLPKPIASAALQLIAPRGARHEVSHLAANLGFVMRTTLGMAVLAIGANVLASVLVAGMIAAVNRDLTDHQMAVTVDVAIVYVLCSAVLASVLAAVVQRRTLRWVLRGDPPTEAEARRAVSLPRDIAAIAFSLWAVGCVVMIVTQAFLGATWRATSGVCGGVIVAGLVAAGITYLLVDRVARPITQLALEAWPPRAVPLFDLRWRLMALWALTSGTPIVGILLVLTARGPQKIIISTAITAGVISLSVGAFATFLAARRIGTPLLELTDVLEDVRDGNLDVSVPVADAAEIGLVQNSVNQLVEGLRERDRISDLFGRHVGLAVAQEALRSGVTLSGEVRDVVALFVDITGSTAMTGSVDPVEFVAMLNRFFEIVVEEVEASGGLVNKFEGDAALAVFGAPMALIDPAGAALRAARRMRDRVDAIGEVQIGVGVAYGPVVAGQVGARSRLEFTVIGDAVNEASRLTDLAKLERHHLLASGPTVEQAAESERSHWTHVGSTVLRGRSRPTDLWTA